MSTDQVNTETGEIYSNVLPKSINRTELMHRAMSDEFLVQELEWAIRQEETVKANRGKVEMELMRRAAESGATTIYGKGMQFIIETKNETDWSKMPPVLEFLTPEEKAEAFKPEHNIMVPAVPEHEKLIPAKWAVKNTVSKLARRHGDEALVAIEAATFPGEKKGKLVRTEETDG